MKKSTEESKGRGPGDAVAPFTPPLFAGPRRYHFGEQRGQRGRGEGTIQSFPSAPPISYLRGKVNSADGSRCFRALTWPPSMTNSQVTSENSGMRNFRPLYGISFLSGCPTKTRNRFPSSFRETWNFAPVWVS